MMTRKGSTKTGEATEKKETAEEKEAADEKKDEDAAGGVGLDDKDD